MVIFEFQVVPSAAREREREGERERERELGQNPYTLALATESWLNFWWFLGFDVLIPEFRFLIYSLDAAGHQQQTISSFQDFASLIEDHTA